MLNEAGRRAADYIKKKTKPRLCNATNRRKIMRADWIGTPTHAQLNSTIGQIGTSIQSATTLTGRIGTSTQAAQ